MRTAVWWIRRDIRLEDNPALRIAASSADRVIPLVILDEDIQRCSCPRRLSAFLAAVDNLKTRLNENHCDLALRQGKTEEVLPRFVRETGASEVIAEEDFSRYSRSRDDQIRQAVALRLTEGLTIQHPSLVRQSNGNPYTVYTAFKNAWKKLPLPRTPLEEIPFTKLRAYQPVTDAAQAASACGRDLLSEGEVSRQLEEFLSNKSSRYDSARDFPAEEGTSLLSACLRFGVLSSRKAMSSAQTLFSTEGQSALMGLRVWMDELIWRDFFHNILFYYPHVQTGPFRENWLKIHWEDDPQKFAAWKNGMTGYPIVDAGMRQLRQTGWMHNRVRMITASFLVKDLFINWQEGERWFMAQLIDGDPALNNGNWQWAAGCGTDAAPYFRVFNPTLQSRKFDPRGEYIRRWIPELRNAPDESIHAPWLMPLDAQTHLGIRIGLDYPAPIVDHALARERFIEQIKSQLRGAPLDN